MSVVKQHKDLHSYAKHIENNCTDVPIKIMGAKRSNAYFSLSMMLDMWQRIPNPDTALPFQTMSTEFGEITIRGSLLHDDKVYSAIIPPSKGLNLFQGDIIELDLSVNGTKHPKHRFSVVLSHSCDVQKLSHIFLAPAYLESELTASTIQFLRSGKSTNQQQVEQFVRMWIENEHIPFIGLPASQILQEPIIIALPLASHCAHSLAISQKPALRLTYRALNYLHGRLATALTRDVQDSDETREL